MEKEKDKKAIARFLQERFEERYLAPFDANKRKHGFIMMASACLMIEALESFWQGWRQSPNSALAFCQFFERSNRFNAIRGLSGEFYRHVRCGIMHQAETTGGWHIRRDLRLLFDKSTKTIDATVFLKEMRASLFEYCKALERASWQDDVWIKLRKKMKSVCANTERSA
jgi:hypothetical protein